MGRYLRTKTATARGPRLQKWVRGQTKNPRVRQNPAAEPLHPLNRSEVGKKQQFWGVFGPIQVPKWVVQTLQKAKLAKTPPLEVCKVLVGTASPL